MAQPITIRGESAASVIDAAHAYMRRHGYVICDFYYTSGWWRKTYFITLVMPEDDLLKKLTSDLRESANNLQAAVVANKAEA